MSSTSTVSHENPLLSRSEILRHYWPKNSHDVTLLADCLRFTTRLKALELYDNHVRTIDHTPILVALAENTTVTLLSLERTSLKYLTSALATSLRVNSTITHLNLCGSGIKNRGICVIGPALAVNRGLLVLDLSCNSFSGGPIEPFITGLQAHSTLTKLDLSNCSLRIEQANAIAAALISNPRLTHLDLQQNNVFSSSDLQPTDEALEGFITNLSAIPSLSTLHLGRTGMKLKELSMTLKGLLKCTSLKSLYLGRGRFAMAAEGNRIDLESAMEIAQAFNNGLNLSTLGLSYTETKGKAIRPIARAFTMNTSLTVLDLSGNPLGPKGTGSIAAMLKTNTTLSTLKLSHNEITERAVFSIAQSLKMNSTVTELTLNGNPLKSMGVGYLSDMLETNMSLTRLSLVDTAGGEIPISYIAEALRTNTTLTSIELPPTTHARSSEKASFIASQLLQNRRKVQTLFSTLLNIWGPQLYQI